MPRLLDSVHSGDASLGSHYEERLHVALSNVWRHKLLIVATVVAAIATGIALTLLMSPRYTAAAYLRGGFGAEEAMSISSGEKSGYRGVIALDASMLVETRSRLLQSELLAHRVVQRLGLEQLRPVAGEGPLSSWLRTLFFGDLTRSPEFQEDMAARRLLRDLSIKTEPRVYLIVIRYSAGDPELAALITNAFVVEFLQTITLQTLSNHRHAAERTLLEALATLGEKHPRVIEARMRLQAADARLKVQRSRTAEEIEQTADGNVTFAQADEVPSSPDPKVVIGLALLVGLAGGIAIAVFRGGP